MKNKKKLIFISHGLNIGGAEKFLISLANSLIINFEVQIVAISPGDALLHELSSSVKFIQIKRNKKIDLNTISELRKFLNKNHDSIVCNMDFFCFFYYRIACFLKRKENKTYISYHSTILKNKKENFLTWLYTRFLRKNDLILTVSKNQALYTSKRFGIKLNKFHSIHNGIDFSKWVNDDNIDFRKIIREKYSIPNDSKVIVITAALREEKNHVMAIRALYHMHINLNCKAYLLLVGGGDLFDDIKTEVLNNKLENYVVFAGSQNNVKSFYYASDIFSLTSFSETFSIAVLEAMSCGLPCVITDVGGANEMIISGENGYLSEVNEFSIAENWCKALNTRFSEKVIIEFVATNFDVKTMVRNYVSVFNDEI